jgi:hypothetical protein
MSIVKKAVVLLLSGACLAVADDPDSKKTSSSSKLPKVNSAIVAFAREQLGKSVGDGECTTLVVHALRAGNAECQPEGGLNGDYVWGTLVEARSEVLPGDILQFRDAEFSGSRRVARDGHVFLNIYKRTMPHHTAIVEEVRERGRVLVVLHQNVGDEDTSEEARRRVHRDVLRLRELQKGTVKAYRPIEQADEPLTSEAPPRDCLP